MKCIFCDRRASSGEHIWPDTLGNDLSIKSGLGDNSKSATSIDAHLMTRRISKNRQRNGPLYKLKIKAVCSYCNNGWMNRVDERAVPILRRMLWGNRANLSVQMMNDIAAFVYLKTLVSEYKNPQTTSLGRQEAINFYLTGKVPGSFRIWLGRCTHPVWFNAYHRQFVSLQQTSGQVDRVAITTWGIGELVIFTESKDIAGYYGDPAAGKAIRIGLTSYAVQWPPILNLSVEDVSTIATRYAPDYPSAAEVALGSAL